MGKKVRNIARIIFHCSDSDYPQHDSARIIRFWHKAKGWDDIGYHNVITKQNGMERGRPIHIQGAHCYGHNANSLGICLTGKKIFSNEQLSLAADLAWEYMCQFGLGLDDLHPHNKYDFDKTCPNFDVNIIKEIISERYKCRQEYLQQCDSEQRGKRHRLRKRVKRETISDGLGRKENVDR